MIGDQGVGMFEQLAGALKETKMVVACVSDQYANSVNCRMEFQFAFRSLQRPVLPLVVGTGSEWNKTVVGIMIGVDDQLQPINLQDLNTESDFKTVIAGVIEKVGDILKIEDSTNKTVKKKSRKPKIGDHIISHHVGHNYYTGW